MAHIVSVEDVREELRALGRDDVTDDAIERFLTERRRGGEKSGATTTMTRREEDDEAEWFVEEVKKNRSTRRGESRRRASSLHASARPPWDSDAFEAVLPPPPTSLRLDELPRRRADSTSADAIQGRDQRGRIDVVRVGAMYRALWEKVAPIVVQGRRRPREGFAERFAAEHRREARRRDKLLKGGRQKEKIFDSLRPSASTK